MVKDVENVGSDKLVSSYERITSEYQDAVKVSMPNCSGCNSRDIEIAALKDKIEKLERRPSKTQIDDREWDLAI